MTSNDLNPFEPPRADESSEEPKRRARRRRADAGGLVLARPQTRFANSVVDTIVYVGIAAVLDLDEGGFVASYGVFFAYYLGFEALTGKTPGKWVTGTRVVTSNGRRPSFGRLVKRSLVRFIPIEALSFLGRPGEGWHDRWSDTRVVHEPDDSRRRRRG